MAIIGIAIRYIEELKDLKGVYRLNRVMVTQIILV